MLVAFIYFNLVRFHTKNSSIALSTLFQSMGSERKFSCDIPDRTITAGEFFFAMS
jgi:hypothetical protein